MESISVHMELTGKGLGLLCLSTVPLGLVLLATSLLPFPGRVDVHCYQGVRIRPLETPHAEDV